MSAHGGSTTNQESIYEDKDAGKGVIRIAGVAALGGFLFGYDSAVINGAVSAVSDEFDTSAASLGFAVASALLGPRSAH
jgi:MFS transporter, SP family, sugar:H+ symporter